MCPQSGFYYSGVSAWMGHAPFAYWLVSALKPRTIVELGTHYGDSFFALCRAVRENKTDSKCFAVDSWEGDKHAGFFGQEVFEAVSAHNEANYKDFSILIRSTFSEAASSFEDGSIDLLHIDGLHTYDAVRQDVEAWMPKLAPDGVLLLHDTHEKREDFGVYKLWDELMGLYPNHLDFAHSHGLGVLSRTDAFSLELKAAAYWGPNWKTVIESTGFLSEQISQQKSSITKTEEHCKQKLEVLESDLRSQMQALLLNESKLQSLVTSLKSENAEFAAQTREAERQLGVVTTSLDQVLASKSWLVTSPFRYIVRHLGITIRPRS